MNRALAVPALLAAAALTLTACSDAAAGKGSANGGGEKAEVVLWMYPVIPDETASREFWTGVEADFEAENENVDLTIELQPWDKQTETIATAIAGGTGPDLVLITPSQALGFHASSGLKPVTDGIADKDAFLPAALEAATFDGDLYGIPIYHTSTSTIYNKAAFEEAGVTELPETWEEVKAAAPKLAENDVAVFDYAGSPDMTLNLSFYPLLWQAGGRVFTEDGTDVAFDSPEGVEALQFLLDLKEMGGLVEDAATIAGPIEGGPLGTGKSAMRTTAVRADVDILAAAIGEENVEVGLPLENEERVSFGVPGILALTAINEEANEEAALAVANYLATPEVSHELQATAGNFPARTDSVPPGDDPDTQLFADALEFARSETFPNAVQVQAALKPHLQAALLGDKTAEEALADAAAEARDIIARGE
jgi:multiple sugar transport system substrate-binding protein